ncbi:MAG: SLATT domain-containing protein [Proteiniphilum sp.]
MAVNSPHKIALKNQIREAYGKVVYTYTTHLKKMNQIDNENRRIKYLQIALSAFSASGFVGSRFVIQDVLILLSGLSSFALLALNLFYKNFNLVEESNQHRVASDCLWLIREQYVSLLTDFDSLSEDDIVKKRDSLQEDTFQIYCKSPKTDEKSYRAAQNALKNEEEQCFTEEEIDKMLPKHLWIDKANFQESSMKNE